MKKATAFTVVALAVLCPLKSEATFTGLIGRGATITVDGACYGLIGYVAVPVAGFVLGYGGSLLGGISHRFSDRLSDPDLKKAYQDEIKRNIIDPSWSVISFSKRWVKASHTAACFVWNKAQSMRQSATSDTVAS